MLILVVLLSCHPNPTIRIKLIQPCRIPGLLAIRLGLGPDCLLLPDVIHEIVQRLIPPSRVGDRRRIDRLLRHGITRPHPLRHHRQQVILLSLIQRSIRHSVSLRSA